MTLTKTERVALELRMVQRAKEQPAMLMNMVETYLNRLTPEERRAEFIAYFGVSD